MDKENCGCEKSIENNFKENEIENNSSLYLEMLDYMMKKGKEFGIVEYEGYIPTINELSSKAQSVSMEIMISLTIVMDDDDSQEFDEIRRMYTIASWCTYAGMGAVYYWNKDWDESKSTGIVEFLSAPEGIGCLDDVVFDTLGIGRDSRLSDEIRDLLANISIEVLMFELKNRTYESVEVSSITRELYKAMYLFGIAIEMNRLSLEEDCIGKVRKAEDVYNNVIKEKRELLISEKELVRARMDSAMNAYYENPGEQTLEDVFFELIYAVIYNITWHIAVEIDNDTMTTELYETDEFGWVYTAYSNAEELAKSPLESSVIMTTRKLFERIVNDNLPGVIINPYKELEKGVLIFVRKENIINILKYAEDSIANQPEYVQKILRGEL